jgi:aspartate aminotransferase
MNKKQIIASLNKIANELDFNNLYKEGKIKAANDLALSEYLLEQVGVAVVPGSAFGAEGYFRISFATSMDNLRNALDRIEKALS